MVALITAGTSCGPESSRIFVAPTVDESPPGAVGSPAPGGVGSTEIVSGAGGTGGSGGTFPAVDPPPRPPPPSTQPPDAAPPAPDGAPDRPIEAKPPVDVGPPPADAGGREAPVADAGPPAAQPPPGIDLRAGLISRWKLDEASGNAVLDVGPAANHGTISGAARVSGGFPAARHPNPGSLRLDGDNDFVELGTRNLPANNQRQSVVFWVNVVAATQTENRVCVSMTDGQGDGSRLKIGFQDGRVVAWSSETNLVTAPALSAGWHHYVYSYDGTTHRLFLDGAQRGSATTTPDSGAVRNARIGALFNNAENFLGRIDDVRVYNRALSPAEVTALRAGFE